MSKVFEETESVSDAAPERYWDEADLERLLEESKKVRGNSLWKDAMQRFKRKRVARAACWGLVLLSLLCLFTPLLPFAPPGRVRLEEQYQAPSMTLWRDGWSIEDYGKTQAIRRDRLNWHTRWMIETRASLFGDGEIGPL
ncbi:MAG: hypothetical protein ACE5F1_07055, partial [Planctomycetota bacterium]